MIQGISEDTLEEKYFVCLVREYKKVEAWKTKKKLILGSYDLNLKLDKKFKNISRYCRQMYTLGQFSII